jgi:hypothetical protein
MSMVVVSTVAMAMVVMSLCRYVVMSCRVVVVSFVVLLRAVNRSSSSVNRLGFSVNRSCFFVNLLSSRQSVGLLVNYTCDLEMIPLVVPSCLVSLSLPGGIRSTQS